MSAGTFLDDVFAFLPPEERTVVILHCLEHRSLADVAEQEKIDMATVTARYRRGIEKLEQVEEEQRRSGVIAIPAALGGGSIPVALLDSAWKRVAQRLGLPESPESEPPPSGPRRRSAAPRSHLA